MKIMKIGKLAIFLLVTWLVSGCSFPFAGTKDDRDKHLVSVTPGKSGDETNDVWKKFSDRAYLRGNFPPDLPIYPKVTFETEGSTGTNSGFVVFSSASPPQQITKYYEENMEKLGWTIAARSSDKSGTSFSIFKKDLASTVGIRKDSDKTYLTITFGPP